MVGSRFCTEQFTYSGHYGLEIFHKIGTFFLQKSNAEENLENDIQKPIIWKKMSWLKQRSKPNWRFRGKLSILQTENCFNSSRKSNSLRCPGDESIFSTFPWPVWAGACLKWTNSWNSLPKCGIVRKKPVAHVHWCGLLMLRLSEFRLVNVVVLTADFFGYPFFRLVLWCCSAAICIPNMKIDRFGWIAWFLSTIRSVQLIFSRNWLSDWWIGQN